MHGFAWLLTICLLVAVVRAAGGEKETLTCLPPKSGGTMLRAHLVAECQKHFDARRAEVEALTTPEQIVARQKRVKAAWLDAIGPFPEKTPLKAKIVGTLDRGDYRVEKVIYESRPNHHVTGNLYLPKKGKGPFPGVLVPCGHSGNGKASVAYQTASILMAKHGFVSLCYDPFGQGERIQTLDAKGKRLAAGTGEHTLVDIGARLCGLGASNYRIWDGIRSIDYLCSRPEVDPKRIGCTGNSGGGTMTSYLMATDERIFAAAPSCYITSLEKLFATIGPQDGEQNVTGQVALGIEHADYLSMRLPRPTLILAATKDFFDIGGTWETLREAKRLASILGCAERVDILEMPGGHGYGPGQRTAALRWMRRWLLRIDDQPTEGNIKPEKDPDIQCTKSGQVLTDLKGAPIWDFTIARAKALAPQREAFWKDNPKATCLAEVKRLAGIRPRRIKAEVKAVGSIEREGYRIEKLVLERKGEVPVPALLFVPKPRKGELPGVLYADGRGKARDARPGGAVEKLVKAGRVVLSIDLRGCGETTVVKPRRYWNPEFSIAYLAIHINRCLLGQRVEDAREALEALAARPEVDAAKLSIIGIERGGPVALHLAAIDERIGEVAIAQSIESWMDVVHTRLCKNQLNQIVPRALTRYDLPDLVAAIAPQKVTIRNPMDPTGKPKSQ
ncbi:acetylxylan esterase [Planctomycetota bacterium]